MTQQVSHDGRTVAPPEPSGARLVATLALAGLLSGLAIVAVYSITLPIIEANNARELREAVFEVVPGAEGMVGYVARDGEVRPATEGEIPDVYAAFADAGRTDFLGYAIPGEGNGFQDKIRLIFGYLPGEQRIVGMKVLESRETPGLGDKIYKDAGFVANFEDLAAGGAIVCVKLKPGESKGPGQVDAITGATISSKAVTRIIDEARERWIETLPPGPPPAGPADVAPGEIAEGGR